MGSGSMLQATSESWRALIDVEGPASIISIDESESDVGACAGDEGEAVMVVVIVVEVLVTEVEVVAVVRRGSSGCAGVMRDIGSGQRNVNGWGEESDPS